VKVKLYIFLDQIESEIGGRFVQVEAACGLLAIVPTGYSNEARAKLEPRRCCSGDGPLRPTVSCKSHYTGSLGAPVVHLV